MKPRSQVHKLRLLLVDDDPSQLDVLAAELSKLGVKVAVGDRSDNGYEQATKVMPDAVISDLASPGEQSWTFVRQLRRHPILRWTPVLLLRWWEKIPDGEKQVLLDRVLDRLEEMLAPLRVLSDRIAAGRPLSEQIEMTGPSALLRLLADACMSGLLIVNDTFSMFELLLKSGKPHSLTRRGVDSVIDEGEDAFLQLLLCDSGRWSFKSHAKKESRANIVPDMEQALSKAGQLLTALFGTKTNSEHRQSSHLGVRMDVLSTLDSNLSVFIQQVAKSIRTGATSPSLDSLLSDTDSVFKVERALQTLIRCGAICPQMTVIKKKRSPAEQRAADSVAYLFDAVIQEHANITELSESGIHLDSIPTIPIEGQQPSSELTQTKGAYRFSRVKPERVGAKIRETIRVPGAKTAPNFLDFPDTPRQTVPVDEPNALKDPPLPSQIIDSNKRKPQAVPKQQLDALGGKQIGGLIRDSQAPSPTPVSRDSSGKKQMWLAIALAVLLIGVLAAGLAYISAGGR